MLFDIGSKVVTSAGRHGLIRFILRKKAFVVFSVVEEKISLHVLEQYDPAKHGMWKGLLSL
jgi:hypothetical protein